MDEIQGLAQLQPGDGGCRGNHKFLADSSSPTALFGSFTSRGQPPEFSPVTAKELGRKLLLTRFACGLRSMAAWRALRPVEPWKNPTTPRHPQCMVSDISTRNNVATASIAVNALASRSRFLGGMEQMSLAHQMVLRGIRTPSEITGSLDAATLEQARRGDELVRGQGSADRANALERHLGLSVEQATMHYRVAGAAPANAVRHAGAGRVESRPARFTHRHGCPRGRVRPRFPLGAPERAARFADHM
jgi:hypothetical protein